MFRKLFPAVALAVFAVTSFAIPKPSEVKDAFDHGNYAKAESMLNEVVQEHPTAQVHYQLGQVYAKEGKHALALNELRQAQALDPSLKFATSAAMFTKILADEQNIVSPPPVVVQAQAPVYVAPTHTSSNAGGGNILYVLIGIIMFGLGGYGLYVFFSGRRAKQDEVNAESAEVKEKTSTLLGFSKQLEDAELIAKSAVYSDAMKSQIIDRITALRTSIRGAIGDLKDGRQVSASRLVTIETNVNTIVEQANNGLTVTPMSSGVNAAPSPFTPPRPMPPTPTPPGWAPAAPDQPVFRHYSSPSVSQAPAPAPVIVQSGSSGSDLLTGVLLGSMMGDHHDRTVYVDRDRPVMDSPRRERDEYVAPSRPQLDTGNDDRNDSYSSGSSSIDMGPDSSSIDMGSSGGDSY